MGNESFSDRVIKIIQNIPYGRVSTYGTIAKLAGNPQAARTVSWLLHSSSEKYKLPWHRVINSRGGISLPSGMGLETQLDLLIAEKIEVDEKNKIDLKKYGWMIEEDL